MLFNLSMFWHFFFYTLILKCTYFFIWSSFACLYIKEGVYGPNPVIDGRMSRMTLKLQWWLYSKISLLYLEILPTPRLSLFFLSLLPHFDKFERYSPKNAFKTVNRQKDIYTQTGGQTDTMRFVQIKSYNEIRKSRLHLQLRWAIN